MKRLIVLITLAIAFSTAFSQDYSEEELRTKLRSSLKMKSTGQGLVVGGVIFNVIGIPLYIMGVDEAGVYEYDSYGNRTNETDGLGKMLGGLALMVVGDIALAGGITFWIIGGARSNRYKRLLDDPDSYYSLVLKTNNRGIGFQLNF